jgi:NAD(P)H-dependent FMN reductase
MGKQKVLAISGSTRKNSSNEKILKAISTLFDDTIEMEIFTGIDHLPHFDPDSPVESPPAAVKHFLELIAQADGVLICTPEYVFSLPGTLKNALEWTVSSTVFSYKPCAFIVASGLGEKTFESLGIIMRTLIQEPVPATSTLLIQGARNKVNDIGKFADAKTEAEISGVIHSFMACMEKASARTI